ncbi:sensor domain-containing phosphodiesterase [Motilimonas pumila]|uniref:cyclic-guanylate-specific phosphodiesterase n=1 Tax=Motilimonas pumila TaxID=2303987 RepID=A0A418YJY2_9GAMM|nr:EAL domain-containing protein [Motilimonas pumila]RJG51279.1 EAL domain-containing protein [Motilimonas pumila]
MYKGLLNPHSAHSPSNKQLDSGENVSKEAKAQLTRQVKSVHEDQSLFWYWDLSQDTWHTQGCTSDKLQAFTAMNGQNISHMIRFVAPEDRDDVERFLNAAIIGEGLEPIEYRLRLNDDEFWVTTAVSQVIVENNHRKVLGITTEQTQFRSVNNYRQKQNAALLQLATEKRLEKGESLAFFDTLCRQLMVTLPVTHVGVWLMDENGYQLSCVATAGKGELCVGEVESQTRHPWYFEQLSKYSVLVNEVTTEDNNPVASSLETLPSIQGIISSHGRVRGLIFCQPQDELYLWSLDEQNFLQSVAELATRVLDISQKSKLERARQQKEQLIDVISHAVSAETGQGFFNALVTQLSQALSARVVCICEIESDYAARNVAMINDGQLQQSMIYYLTDTPAELVQSSGPQIIREHASDRYPAINELLDWQAKGYIAWPLTNGVGELIGLIILISDEPLPEESTIQSVLKIFSIRATAELVRKQDEAELKLSAVAFETNEGIIIADPNGHILRVNSAFEEITGYQVAEVVGKDIDILNGDRREQEAISLSQKADENGRWSGECWRLRKNGELYPQWETITLVRDDRGNVTHYVICFEDISERKAAEKKIQSLAYFDELTGLPNRRFLLEKLSTAFDVAIEQEMIGAVLFIDLDHFKAINDSLGHAAGDWVLESVAKRLKAMIRDGDILARLGGDEFVLLLPALSANPPQAEQQANLVGERLIKRISAPYRYHDQDLHIGASVGVTLFPGKNQSADDLLKQADTAMYQAKSAGRKTLMFFDMGMQKQADKRLNIHNALRSAIEKNEFLLHYQPQHMVNTGELVGVEVLVRWMPNNSKMMVSPAEFIPIAEESDLIIEIGMWVLFEACRQFVEWQKAGVYLPQIAVNVSPKQFHHVDFVEQVEEAIRVSGMEPSHLNLEITESVVLGHAEETIRKMTQLKEMGISFSVDDFGAGYSSLSYLKRLPADELKIDRSFIRDIPRDASDMAIVEAVLALSRHMGFSVTAEGVETRQQLEFLQKQECNFYQGYFASKPIAADAMVRYLDKIKTI